MELTERLAGRIEAACIALEKSLAKSPQALVLVGIVREALDEAAEADREFERRLDEAEARFRQELDSAAGKAPGNGVSQNTNPHVHVLIAPELEKALSEPDAAKPDGAPETGAAGGVSHNTTPHVHAIAAGTARRLLDDGCGTAEIARALLDVVGGCQDELARLLRVNQGTVSHFINGKARGAAIHAAIVRLAGQEVKP